MKSITFAILFLLLGSTRKHLPILCLVSSFAFAEENKITVERDLISIPSESLWQVIKHSKLLNRNIYIMYITMLKKI